jgi:hypothetical protein
VRLDEIPQFAASIPQFAAEKHARTGVVTRAIRLARNVGERENDANDRRTGRLVVMLGP